MQRVKEIFYLTMKNKLLKVIAEHTTYSFEECKSIYEQLKSYDGLLFALDAASTFNVTLQEIVDIIYESKD